jgi:4-hydroxybenzoate polyprenyltransferase
MTKTADALARHWTDHLPPRARALAQLSRLDRPIGWQLLALPCLMGLGVGRNVSGYFLPDDVTLAVLFVVGAIAMRGAGCVWNDVLDRDLDAKVARTASRPLPSGRISVTAALVWLAVQCGVGLIVLLALPGAPLPGLPVNLAQAVALAAVPLVAAYPLMKRITWWPQVWLGMVFSWGVLVAGAAIQGSLSIEIILFYIGCVAWTIAYDTIYALQDKDDDALIGVRSTARLFGARWRTGVLIFFGVALFFWTAGLYTATGALWIAAAIGAVGALLVWPLVDSVHESQPATALHGFRRNGVIGLTVLAISHATPFWITLNGAGPP